MPGPGLVFVSTYAVLAGLFLSPFVTVGALLGCVWTRARPHAIAIAASALICGVASAAALMADAPIERAGVNRVIERGRSLVQAIERFTADRGRTPESLSELVPAYIPEVPTTGASAFPEFEFYRESASPQDWRLTVYIGTIVFDWKHLQYRPDGYRNLPASPRAHGWAVIDP